MIRRIAVVLAIGIAVGLGIGWVARYGGEAAVPAASAAPGPGVVLTCSHGSVLTADGGIWVYRPDQDRWLTVDQAFREEGTETHVVPLPVPVAQIKEMASFGFLLTQSGEVWIYEISTDKWRKLPPPA